MIPEPELNKSTSTLGFNIQLNPSWERKRERETYLNILDHETHVQNEQLRLTDRERQLETLSFQNSSSYLSAFPVLPLFSFIPLFLKEPN